MNLLGVDTLEFGLDIEDYENRLRPVLDIFKLFKEESQKLVKPIEEEINGINMTVEKSGMPFYSYRLTCNDFIIGFSDKEIDELSPVRVKFLSSFLWSYGYRKAFKIFMDWFNYFELNVFNTRISRLDICVDSDEVKFGPADLNCFVTRAKAKNTHFVSDEYKEGRQFSGFTIGRGQPLLARIYDKSKEIKRSGKVWFNDIWENKGWKGEKPIWRVEFQLRREVLKEFGITTVEDLFGKELRLWSYLTSEWLQLKNIKGKNTSRCTVKHKWKIIQKADMFEDIPPLVREKVKMGDMKRLMDQATGLIISIGARGNYKNLDQVLNVLKGWEELKLTKEGKDFDKKIQERRIKFIK